MDGWNAITAAALAEDSVGMAQEPGGFSRADFSRLLKAVLFISLVPLYIIATLYLS